MFKTFRTFVVLLGALLLSSSHAAEFPPELSAGPSLLLRNGHGECFKPAALEPQYAMALYVAQPAKNAEGLVQDAGPAMFRFVARRATTGQELGHDLIKGMRANNSVNDVAMNFRNVLGLAEAFSSVGKIAPGEQFAIEYVPGTGTMIYVNGTKMGSAVGDVKFFSMVKRIWLGSLPADARLKVSLLGLGV